jgi:hypothetical protein
MPGQKFQSAFNRGIQYNTLDHVPGYADAPIKK